MSIWDKIILVLSVLNIIFSALNGNFEGAMGWLFGTVYFTLYALEKGEKK